MAAINTRDIERQVAQLATTLFAEFSQSAISDGKAFLTEVEDDLIEATEEHARGEITDLEFQEAIKDLRAEAKMEKLKQEGLAQVSLDKFTTGIIDCHHRRWQRLKGSFADRSPQLQRELACAAVAIVSR
jgi:hypothetical protein